jgi:hypothetical protein
VVSEIQCVNFRILWHTVDADQAWPQAAQGRGAARGRRSFVTSGVVASAEA